MRATVYILKEIGIVNLLTKKLNITEEDLVIA